RGWVAGQTDRCRRCHLCYILLERQIGNGPERVHRNALAPGFLVDLEDLDFSFALLFGENKRLKFSSRHLDVHQGAFIAQNGDDSGERDWRQWRSVGFGFGRGRRWFEAENVSVYNALVRISGVCSHGFYARNEHKAAQEANYCFPMVRHTL